MNRRDFIKTVCAAVGTWVGWSRVGAASSVVGPHDAPGANWSTAPARQPNTFRLIGPQTGMWRDMGMLDNKDAGFTMTHTDETLRGMAVPFAVAGEGRFSLVDDDGMALHIYLPVVRDGK